jgi:hypothetical protein
MSGTSSGHTRRRVVNGPAYRGGAVTSPMGHAQWMLMRVIPHEYAHAEHYDQRRLACVKCGNAPRKAILLLDSEEGYICKALGACAKRQAL